MTANLFRSPVPFPESLWNQGRCAEAVTSGEAQPEDWFAPPGARTTQWATRAALICSYCPVQETCLAYARDAGMDGIWGGTWRQRAGNEFDERPLIAPATRGDRT